MHLTLHKSVKFWKLEFDRDEFFHLGHVQFPPGLLTQRVPKAMLCAPLSKWTHQRPPAAQHPQLRIFQQTFRGIPGRAKCNRKKTWDPECGCYELWFQGTACFSFQCLRQIHPREITGFTQICQSKASRRTLLFENVQFIQFSASVVSDSATPRTAAHQASLSITNSQSLLKLMSISSVMPSNHLILCRPLLLPPSIFPSIRVFSNEPVLRIRWPKCWSFSVNISPSNEHPGLIFRRDWLDLLAVQGTFKSLLQHQSLKASTLHGKRKEKKRKKPYSRDFSGGPSG